VVLSLDWIGGLICYRLSTRTASSVRGIFPSMNTIVTNCDLKVATDVASSNANAVVTFIYFTLRKHLYDVYGKEFNRILC
jgi:hypothetical protein